MRLEMLLILLSLCGACSRQTGTATRSDAYGACSEDGKWTCLDAKTFGVCKQSMWKRHACPGPLGCFAGAIERTIHCDEGPATPGSSCNDDTGTVIQGCSSDKVFSLRCRAGRWTIDESCRGPAGCAIGTRVSGIECDSSLARDGDVCPLLTAALPQACSEDGKRRLECRGGKWTTTGDCAHRCKAKSRDEVVCE